MKKAIRFFSLALAVLMLLPMLSVLPVKVRATETVYDNAQDGELLRSVNFNSGEWTPAFANTNNCGADVDISDDGSAVGFTVLSSSYKRAMWGGFYSGELFPMEPGAKYTMVFDLTLGHDNVALGIQVDGHNALLIRGNGQSYWYGWNTLRVDATSDNNEKWNYHINPDTTKRDAHTFAVTVDYSAKTMALYVKDEDDGCFYLCRSMTYVGSDVWDSAYFRCRLHVRAIDGTPNASYTADLANLKIYKGDAMNALWDNAYALPYASHEDDELLLKADFNSAGWDPAFASPSNQGADVDVSSDGSAVAFTVLSSSYKRAMWGGFYSGEPSGSPETIAYNEALGAALPMEPGAKYTTVFDLTLGHDNVAFGIQVDGHNALVIRGNGQSRWYSWNDYGQETNGEVQPGVGDTSDNNEKWTYHIAEGSTKRDTHTFAVTVDYDAKTMSLFVLDENDGRFYICRSMTYDDQHVWDSDCFRCRLYVRATDGTPNEDYTAEISDLKIYKGLGPAVSRLSVMSYNIEMYGHGGDGWDGRHPEKAVETILDQSPDIVGLQEVYHVKKTFWLFTLIDEGWNHYLPTLTSNGYTRIESTVTDERDNWEDIFYKTEKFNKLSSGTVLFTSLSSAYPGVPANGADMSGKVHTGFTWARLQDKTTGKTILAVSTHLHYRKDKSENPNSAENVAIRRYEIRLLCEWVAYQTYDAVVLLGDMNADYRAGGEKVTINIFKNEGGFAITRDTAAIKGDIGETTDKTNRTIRDNYIFDYIMTKGNVETTYYTVVDNKIDNSGTSYPSDHLPIMANILVY